MILSILTLLIIYQLSVATTSVLKKKSASQRLKDEVVEISYSNVTNNLVNYNGNGNIVASEEDYLIMFYAPWCKYCKVLLPTMQAIAQLISSDKFIVGKFNCEESTEHRNLCVDLQVEYYPTVMFIGYGDFKQSKRTKSYAKGTKTQKNSFPNLVKYTADMYAEAIYDWAQMLRVISNWHRRWDSVVGFFTGNGWQQRKFDAMQRKLELAERKATLFGSELERYKADELFDQLEMHADPFVLLNKLTPDAVIDQNLIKQNHGILMHSQFHDT